VLIASPSSQLSFILSLLRVFGDCTFIVALYNAMKNHYLIVQIAEILRQLYVKGADGIKDLNKGIKEISSCLLESFRTRILTAEDIAQIGKAAQVRFT